MFEWTDGTDYLMHYGTKGQKWGRRLYQYEDGSLTPLGRIHYGIGQARDSAKKAYDKVANPVKWVLGNDAYRSKRRRQIGAEKARKAKEEQSAKKAELEKILKTGTAEDILKNRDNYTTAQLNEAFNRLNAEKNLKSMLPKEKSAMDKLQNLKVTADRLVGVANTSIATWNMVARISNSMFDTSLKMIGDGSVKGRSAREAKKILKSMERKKLTDIDQNELSDIVKKINLMSGLEKTASGKSGGKS